MLCFPRRATARPWHSDALRLGDIHQDRKLSHVFSPVPGAWGHSCLSCGQDQTPSLDTGADPKPQRGLSSHPGAGTCPWHPHWEGTAPTMKV